MKKLLIVILSLLVLAFLWWTISPLFIDIEVNDELSPEFEAVNKTESATTTDAPVTEPEPIASPVTVEDTGATESERQTPLVRGPFAIADTPAHPASGNVRVLQSASESIVRFEDYDGTNGPDLYVYLAKDLDAEEFVSLGRAKGNQGNINYEVPADVDISEYQYVLTWCQAFGVLFDYARIN